MSTLDFSKIPNYSQRQMFLDPAGPVTIQRYEEFAYPKINQFLNAQTGSFWKPEEITLVKDQIDFKEANKAVRHIFTSNLLRQTTLDSVQGRAPVQVFTPVCSVPEMEALVLWWSSFEQIHSQSYSHIIKNIYNVPVEEFNRIHDVSEIVEMASGIMKFYDDLHILNSKKIAYAEGVKRGAPKEVLKYLEVSEHEHVKAIWMALIASYGLEAIRFMVSFATSLGMVENKIFMGSGNIISLILQDETLHTKWTSYVINKIVKDDPRFAQVKDEMRKEAFDAIMQVLDEEKTWAKYVFKEGTVIGLNAPVMIEHVDHTAEMRLKEIGMKYNSGVKHTPFPWFNKHLNTNKKQTALQENESVAYIIGALTSTINYDELPEI